MRVILCPHYDDGLLSLPDLLLVCPHALRLVVVFSDEDPALAAVCEAQHRRLGLVTQCLGLSEARRRGVELRQVLRSGRAAATCLHDPLVNQIVAGLAGVVPAEAEVLAPLGLVHLDHALVRLAAEQLCLGAGRPALALYADEPYATVWPSAAARACRGLESLCMVPTAAPEAVSAMLAPLVPFVGRRDLDRLARARSARQRSGTPLWRIPLQARTGATD